MGTGYRRLTLTLTLCALAGASSATRWVPCVELKRELHVACRCSPAGGPEEERAIEMNCDRTVLTRDKLDRLRGQGIVAISQRNAGHGRLPEELLEAAGPSLRRLDLSENSIEKLMAGRLVRAQPRLEELRLADNLLGDSLNPIFSSNEFHGLSKLRLLDLSRNGLRGIEEGILKGCESLEQLYLDGNELTAVPSESLKGPRALRDLSLSGNAIGSLPRAALAALGQSLLRLDISENELSHMEDDALAGLDRLLLLNVSRNELARFNSDVFKGAYNLLQLDLSANFLRDFPTDALRHLTELKFLNASNNLIDAIEQQHLAALTELRVLDLSRNSIGRLGVKTFAKLSELLELDLSVNQLRTIEEAAFEGLTKLRRLSLRDNNILLVPAAALSRLPSLTELRIEYNRVAALPRELIEATASSLASIGLARNLLREIPAGLFQDFRRLRSVELAGNALTSIGRETFRGLEETLLHLDLSSNRLASIEQLPLPKLASLNLAGNRLTRVSPDAFASLTAVRRLNLSSNPLYGGFPPVLPPTLADLDASRTDLRVLPTVLLLNLDSLERISLRGNRLRTLERAAFDRLANLTRIDLSGNRLERIEAGAFVGLRGLRELDLSGNELSSFAGEHFDTGTGLEILDLSRNRLDRVSATAFAIHPRLRLLDLSGNRFVRFPGEYLRPVQFLERLDLSRNRLTRVTEFSFSQLGHLRLLNLAANRIESIEELAFHNSSQLQRLDLSGNEIESLGERTMEGLLRLERLDLRDNRLASLPETVFEPGRVRAVESVDLSGNRLTEIPARSLDPQAGTLVELNLARNRIGRVAGGREGVAAAARRLDLSENPLSPASVRAILAEPRILRAVNLAGTGIDRLEVGLETPFLRELNLSGNALTELPPALLDRVTALRVLDLSRNRLADLRRTSAALGSASGLRRLDLSGNRAIPAITEGTFDALPGLRALDVSGLTECTRIERTAFGPLAKLRELTAHGYPKLGYFDAQGILKGMTGLEAVDIEIKDSKVGNEQLSLRTHPRLRELVVRGERLRGLLSSSLVGLRGPRLAIRLRNTSVDSIPAGLFFPVPRSTELRLDLAGTRLSRLSGQFLAALEERAGSVAIHGLGSIPIVCDCDARPLRRWLNSTAHQEPVICAAPARLAGSRLAALAEDRLACEPAEPDHPPATVAVELASSAAARPTSYEPEIIWTVAPPAREAAGGRAGPGSAASPAGLGNATDDTLIIGIVAGVVAFVALIVIAIFVCRVRWSVDRGRFAGPGIPDASMLRPSSVYSAKPSRDLYPASYTGSTLDRGNLGIPTTPLRVVPLAQAPVHTLLAPPAHSQARSQAHSQAHYQAQAQAQQRIYGYREPSTLPMYVACSGDAKPDS